MMEYNTIWEDFELPSKGMIYDKAINPKITLRSMTVAEEMKRLSPSETPYKIMCDIIEDCMKEKPDIHVCDMALGDYQFLLHKLRIITYGKDYKMFITCPECGATTEAVADLDTIAINEWDETVSKDQLITLPISNCMVELKFETPRDLDQIAFRNKEMKKKLKSKMDYSILFTLMAIIKKVDGRALNDLEAQEFIKTLPAKDANYILGKAEQLLKKVGINNVIDVTCAECGHKYSAPFRITREFLGPTID